MQSKEKEQVNTNKRIRFYVTLASLCTAIVTILLLWLLHWGINVSRDWNELQNAPAAEAPALKNKFDASLEIAKTIVSGIGTVATIAGGVVLYLNFRVANKQAKIANKQAELTESRLITERFSKAVEQLGGEKIAVRLGGIYALEKIAQDFPETYHWTVIDVLIYCLQENSSSKSVKKEQTPVEHLPSEQKGSIFDRLISESSCPSVAPDIQAILKVIEQRETKNDGERRLDISRLNLNGINLKGANLNRAILKGVNFRGANLDGAILNDTNLELAELNQANLNQAELNQADLNQAELTGAKLNWAKLNRAKLRSTLLNSAYLNGADFSMANLVFANLSNTGLSGANFSEAILIGADFSRAKCTEASFNKAQLTEANLAYANFIDVKGLTLEQVKSARNWDKAIYNEVLRKQLGLPLDYDAEIRKEWGLPPREKEE